jgi:preprotein translocase subunit SecE
VGAFVQELFRVSLYKRSQGRVARQATLAVLAVIVALAAWSLHRYFDTLDYSASADTPAATADAAAATADTTEPASDENTTARVVFANVIPLGVLCLGLWSSFRMVQTPSFADFLIAVEGEMNKVSWPSRGELFRASIVVMFVIFFMAAILFLYDYILTWVMRGIESVMTVIFGG